MKITKEQFDKFEKVRASGRTNMFDLRTVSALSGLHKDVLVEIMKRYDSLKKQFAAK